MNTFPLSLVAPLHDPLPVSGAEKLNLRLYLVVFALEHRNNYSMDPRSCPAYEVYILLIQNSLRLWERCRVHDSEERRKLQRKQALADKSQAMFNISLRTAQAVMAALEYTPPELSADIIDKGMVLSGGGAMIRRLDELIAQATGVPCFVADEPLFCVAKGTGVVLENLH